MAAVQAEDVCASFLFVCDLNGHHQEWLGSSTTNRSTNRWVPTHARVGTLDLVMTDVPDLVRVAIVAPIDNSYHYSLSAVISMSA